MAIGLGMPVAALSWVIFYRLYGTGVLDRAANDKEIEQSLKDWKKEEGPSGFLQSRWMKFGGGFYGVAALWTFFCVEVSDLFGFVTDFPGLDALFAGGIVSFAVDVLINQLSNMLNALIWFTWWGGRDSMVVAAFLVAYGGYFVGSNLARREINWHDE